MRTRAKAPAAIAALAALVVLFALAPGARAQPDVPHGPDLLKIAHAVGLSAAQITQIKKIVFGTQRDAIQTQAKLRMAQLELQEAIEGDTPPPEKKVIALIERIGGFETQLKKGHILMMLRIRGAVSKPQWEKLQIMHAERKPPQPPPPPPPPRHP